MLHLIVFGLLLGWGAAIPIGAINLEIIRRNLKFGTSTGLTLGLGACSADVTFLILLSLGMLEILNYPFVLKIVGITGSFILGWFGWMALKQKAVEINTDDSLVNPRNSLWKHSRDGYLLTLINPYSIIFWSSVSATIASNVNNQYSTFYAGLGVLLGTLSWVFCLNVFLHVTRHRISKKTMQKINAAGGVILLGFALFGFLRAVMG